MHNAIEASKRSNARLIFFDNVYMYGKVDWSRCCLRKAQPDQAPVRVRNKHFHQTKRSFAEWHFSTVPQKALLDHKCVN